MIYFDKDFIKFYSDLEKNNNREWFQANKSRYESNVKLPFQNFVKDLINTISEIEGPVPMEAKEAIFRIHRDIRFSKDKTPFKLHAGALISPGGKKDMSTPGLYFQANHQNIRIYSGIYKMTKEQLRKVRFHIRDHSTELNEIIEEQAFKKLFGEIKGEKNKRLPVEFREAAQYQPLLFNTSLYFFHESKPDFILKDDLLEYVLSIHQKSRPLRAYLQKALHN